MRIIVTRGTAYKYRELIMRLKDQKAIQADLNAAKEKIEQEIKQSTAVSHPSFPRISAHGQKYNQYRLFGNNLYYCFYNRKSEEFLVGDLKIIKDYEVKRLIVDSKRFSDRGKTSIKISQHAIERYCERVLGLDLSCVTQNNLDAARVRIGIELRQSSLIATGMIKDYGINVTRKLRAGDGYRLHKDRLYCCSYRNNRKLLVVQTVFLVSAFEAQQLAESSSLGRAARNQDV